MPARMTPQDETPDQPRNDQSRPETGIDVDPSENTTPRSNPPVDRAEVEKGKEKLEGIVNW